MVLVFMCVIIFNVTVCKLTRRFSYPCATAWFPRMCMPRCHRLRFFYHLLVPWKTLSGLLLSESWSHLSLDMYQLVSLSACSLSLFTYVGIRYTGTLWRCFESMSFKIVWINLNFVSTAMNHILSQKSKAGMAYLNSVGKCCTWIVICPLQF